MRRRVRIDFLCKSETRSGMQLVAAYVARGRDGFSGDNRVILTINPYSRLLKLLGFNLGLEER